MLTQNSQHYSDSMLLLDNINTTTVTTIAIMPKGMKVKFSRNFEGEGELNHNTRLRAGCQKGVTAIS